MTRDPRDMRRMDRKLMDNSTGGLKQDATPLQEKLPFLKSEKAPYFALLGLGVIIFLLFLL